MEVGSYRPQLMLCRLTNQFVTRSAEQDTSLDCLQARMVFGSLSRIAAVCFTGWVSL